MNGTKPTPAFAAVAMFAFLLSGVSAAVAQDVGIMPVPAVPVAGDAVPGEYLVRFADDVSEAQIAEINARFGAEVVSRMLDGKVLLIRLADTKSAADIAVLYAATPGVLYIEPNGIVTTQGDAGSVGIEVQ